MAISNNCSIGYLLLDPVKDPIIRKSNDNPFLGYYGYNRWDGGIKRHTGYDYVAKSGTPVYPIYTGDITHVRFGRININNYFEKGVKKAKTPFVCPFLQFVKQGKNKFDCSTCMTCDSVYKSLDNRSLCKDCFGVQVWLKVKLPSSQNFFYAYYAHLSELSPTIFEKCISIEETDNTFKFDSPIHIDTSVPILPTIIGKSGCTGNAIRDKNILNDETQQHLHFECRKGIERIEGRLSPNEIVYTRFYLENKNYVVNKKIINEIDENVLNITEEDIKQEKWLKLIRGEKKKDFEDKVWPEFWSKQEALEWEKFQEEQQSMEGGDIMWVIHVDKIKNEQWEDYKIKEYQIFDNEWNETMKEINKESAKQKELVGLKEERDKLGNKKLKEREIELKLKTINDTVTTKEKELNELQNKKNEIDTIKKELFNKNYPSFKTNYEYWNPNSIIGEIVPILGCPI